jgi:ADP-heptose:LPS heptosyltransferase
MHAEKPMGEHITVLDCQKCPKFEIHPDSVSAIAPGSRRLILVNTLSPGDVLVMSAAIGALHRQHPRKFTTAVATSANPIFEHNPYIQPTDSSMEGAEILEMHYPAINQFNQRSLHFMQAFVEYLSATLQLPLFLDTNRPELYLSEEEKGWINQVEEVTGKPTKFFLVNSGHKKDFTTKNYGHANYQRVVDLLKGEVQFVQIGERHPEHVHRPLRGVIDLVGKTDTRQLIRLAYHAVGGVGPSTFLQHIMAAWQKPYVCLLGGREPVSWTTYPTQITMGAHGLLPCCKDHACDKTRVVPFGNDSDEKVKRENRFCELPVVVKSENKAGFFSADCPMEESVPKCMDMQRPEIVAEAIRQIWKNY